MQKPRYIAQSWQSIFCHMRFSESFSPQSILSFYKSALQTGRELVVLFEGNCQTDQEKQYLDHLKRYVKNLASADLQRLLKVMAGADMI